MLQPSSPPHPDARGAPRLSRSFAFVAVAGLVLMAVHWFQTAIGESLRDSWTARVVAAVALGGLLALAWRGRDAMHRLLISVPFAVAVLTALLAATALGTLVLQGGAPEEYTLRYGSTLAPLMLGLGLDDLFHTMWFDGLLGLLTVSLLFVATRNGVWRGSMAGHVLCHVGIVVILLGGFLGRMLGVRGFIDLHEGQAATHIMLTEAGVRTGERLPLGFALRLDDFEIERYEPEFRVYAHRRKGDSYRRTASYGLDDGPGWNEVGTDGTSFRIVEAWPDFDVLSELRETAGGRPALEIELVHGDDLVDVRLLAGVEGRDRRARIDEAGASLRLVDRAPTAEELERDARPTAPRHVLLVGHPHEEVDLRIGETRRLASGHDVEAVEFQPDFIYDIETRRARSRSELPNNPALSVVVSGPGIEGHHARWLFAHGADTHQGGAPGPELHYRYDAGRVPPERELLVVAETREVWRLEAGAVAERVPLDGPELPGLAGSSYRLFDSAVEVTEPTSLSDEWNNPVVEVELSVEGRSIRRYLGALHGEPLWLPDEVTVLSFESKPNDVQAYRSRLSVLEDGAAVREKTIEVNDPLAHDGFYFYQSNYRDEDPTYSGILVVKDPGFLLVFLGFAMISVGAVFIYYIRPRVLRRGA